MQLKMLWNCKETRYPENHHPLFHYRRFTASDADINQWLSICKHGLIGEDAGYETYEQLLKNWKDYSPQDTFLIEQGGVPAATVTAIVHPAERQGYVHMVAAKPDCRGKGVGRLLNQLACARFWEQGCQTAVLTTDDFRIPAIKSYLTAGFLPVDCDTDMTGRWEAVLKQLGCSNVAMLSNEGIFSKILLPIPEVSEEFKGSAD